MKKSILLGIVGLAAGLATSSYAQGTIRLDNYTSYGPYVTYGAGSDGTVGAGLSSAYTMGIYYWSASGNNTGLVLVDPSGTALPSALNANLLLGSTLGSTAPFGFGATPGAVQAGPFFGVPGSASAGGETWTFMAIAYEGANYANATYRGHSVAFTLTTSASSSPSPTLLTPGMPTFAVFQVAAIPEPTTMALAGLGGLSLLLFRRKQA